MLTNPIKVLKQSELLGHQFTVYGTPEYPLFKANEVASIIEHSTITRMLELVDEDEKGVYQLSTPGGNQRVWFLTEGGLYEVLMQSRKPIAKQFKKGVKQILHEVRTTGGYIATKESDTPEEIMARALMVAQDTLRRRDERIKQLEAQSEQQQVLIEQKDAEITEKDGTIKILTPKGETYDAIMSSQGLVTINMIAAFLGISAKKLNQLLCQWGVQYKQSKCYRNSHLKTPKSSV